MNIFDLHCDTIGECANRGFELLENPLQLSLKSGAGFSGWCQVFAVWLPDDKRGNEAFSYFDGVYNYFLRQTEKNSERLCFCKTAAELENAVKKGKCGAILGIEGGGAIGGSLERLGEMHAKGVRILTLTWNGRCEIGDGSGVENARGLTDFGKSAVREAERLGVVVDVSHLSDRGFYDVSEISQKPFIASHSNSRAEASHVRNLTDEQFGLIARRGGLVGLNLYPVFLGGSAANGREAVYRHLCHFLELGGENTVALGSDFDGADMPDDLRSIDRLPNLCEYLLARGLPEGLINKFLFGNAYDFFHNILQ